MEEIVGSIPTASTIHLPHGWTLNKSTRGQKGADRSDDPVLVFFAAARVTTGHAVSVSIDILRRPFLATFRFANNPRTTHLMDTSAFIRTYLVGLPPTGLLDRNDFRIALDLTETEQIGRHNR